MSRYSERERDFAYMEWVKQQPCLLRYLGDCEGGPWREADHAGDRAYARKCPDRDCIPLCRHHHQQRTDSKGFFRGRTREEKVRRAVWVGGAIAATQKRWEDHRLDTSMIPF